MTVLDILAVGMLDRSETGEVLEAHSTSTLIRSGDSMIVVDTSSKYMRPALRTSFRELGIFPKDVDTVVITHWHDDHLENLDMYPNAEIYAWDGPAADADLRNINIINDELKLCDGVTLVHTPGHTMDSTSVFVEGDDRRYAVVGDAIPLEENYRKMVPPRLNVDPDLAMKSIKSIAGFADVIVPGHGFPFMTR
ncbi:MAG: MBL fold metallo-hydrolase [Candidatus Methanomethylophilaceae archaeon]|nr:MBL fold metallo-hydrolase [Candidatus Methanomethylophilaceae archaeon]MBR7123832.1 MBL fold metallo-hydrolase [Candidatus Methanomethylophilaceae archaeon]